MSDAWTPWLAAFDRLIGPEARAAALVAAGLPSWTGYDGWTAFAMPDGRTHHVRPDILAKIEGQPRPVPIAPRAWDPRVEGPWEDPAEACLGLTPPAELAGFALPLAPPSSSPPVSSSGAQEPSGRASAADDLWTPLPSRPAPPKPLAPALRLPTTRPPPRLPPSAPRTARPKPDLFDLGL